GTGAWRTLPAPGVGPGLRALLTVVRLVAFVREHALLRALVVPDSAERRGPQHPVRRHLQEAGLDDEPGAGPELHGLRHVRLLREQPIAADRLASREGVPPDIVGG